MPEFRQGVRDDTGGDLNGLTVEIYDVDTITPVRATTTTDASGHSAISHATRGKFDVKVTNGDEEIWLRARNRVQISRLEAWEDAADMEAIVAVRTEDVASVEVATFEGDRATPADNDAAYISLKLSDDAGNQDEQARIEWVATTVADGATQDGDLRLHALVNNTLTELFRLDGSASSVNIPVDSVDLIFGAGNDAGIQYDGSNLVLSPALVGSGDVSITGGGLELEDNEPVRFGTGQDASIFYNGTHLIIQPQDVGTGDVVINDTAILFLNETANAQMTTGITINQAAAVDNIFALKNSGVSTGLSAQPGPDVETDDFFTIGVGNQGSGVQMNALADLADSQPFRMDVYSGLVDTTKSTSGNAAFQFRAFEHDGADSLANMTADGNILAVKGYVSAAVRTLFIIDEDGDYHYDGADGGAFDHYDDLDLLRSFTLAASDPKTVIRTEFDNFLKYNEDDLVNAGILGARVEEGGLVNGAQLQRLTVGAVTQLYNNLREVVKVLTPDQKKALPFSVE